MSRGEIMNNPYIAANQRSLAAAWDQGYAQGVLLRNNIDALLAVAEAARAYIEGSHDLATAIRGEKALAAALAALDAHNE